MEQVVGIGTSDGALKHNPSPSLPCPFPILLLLVDRFRSTRMRDEELAGRVGMPTRDLAKIAQRLIEDQIISQ